jgi:hypothetical protein
LIVGAPFYETTINEEGRAYVFLGSPSGLPAQADWIGEGQIEGIEYATSVAGGLDVNGDGCDDVVVGAPHSFFLAWISTEHD